VLLIARLPFAVPTDPLLTARSEEIEAQGGDPFRELALPEAILRFRQGIGRLIRTADDRGAVIVADPRLARSSYGKRFAATLPAPPFVTASSSELLSKVAECSPATASAWTTVPSPRNRRRRAEPDREARREGQGRDRRLAAPVRDPLRERTETKLPLELDPALSPTAPPPHLYARPPPAARSVNHTTSASPLATHRRYSDATPISERAICPRERGSLSPPEVPGPGSARPRDPDRARD